MNNHQIFHKTFQISFDDFPRYEINPYLRLRGWNDQEIEDIKSKTTLIKVEIIDDVIKLEMDGKSIQDIETEKAAIDEDFLVRITIAKLTDGELS